MRWRHWSVLAGLVGRVVVMWWWKGAMIAVRITIHIHPEGGGTGISYELPESVIAGLFPWLLGIPDAGDELGVGRPTIDWIERAYAAIGRDTVSTRDLTDRMLAGGWRTKSRDPVNVVGATLRAVRPRWERNGAGWRAVEADGRAER